MSLKNKSVAIIGLGWLGLPLAKALTDKGLKVIGSTTTIEKTKTIKENDSIEAIVFDLNELNIKKASLFFNCDVLVFNTPPNPKIRDFFKAHTNKDQKTIFISSTSVYSASQGPVNESSLPLPESANGKLLLEIEQELNNLFPNLSIIRPGGLIGEKRHPIYHLKVIKNPESFVHLIFREDLISLIEKIIKNETPPKLINAVAQISMRKKDYYLQMCEKLKLETLTVENTTSKNATFISDELFKKILEKTPRSPLDCSDSLLS